MSLPAQLVKIRIDGGTVAGRDLSRVQDNVGVLINQVAGVPILSGVQIKGVVLGTTAVNVSHGLGRPWANWIVTDRDADQSVWRSASANPETMLTLTASGTVTVNLLVW